MLLDKRVDYRPFKYPEAFEFFKKQQMAHWLPTEIPLSQDIQDWKMNLSESEKSVIGGILKGFTQTEIVVNDYWSNKVAKWFPHPEIAMAATTMAAFETIHTWAYGLLDESLGFDDYKTFLAEPTIKAKLDRLINVEDPDKQKVETRLNDKRLPCFPYEDWRLEVVKDGPKHAIAKSLAIFSAFTEGVSLFSSFAVLLHFSRSNKMKGMSQIVTWSIKDESLHAEFGCWLFRQLIKEYPEIWTDELKKDIYQAARDTISLEDDFLDKVFDLGDIEGLSKDDLKCFIRNRANNQLGKLGLKQNWKNIDKDALKRMEWFDYMVAAPHLDDFFTTKPSDYSKGTVDFDDIF